MFKVWGLGVRDVWLVVEGLGVLWLRGEAFSGGGVRCLVVEGLGV